MTSASYHMTATSGTSAMKLLSAKYSTCMYIRVTDTMFQSALGRRVCPDAVSNR